jgi:hypothetical protein
MTIGAALGRSVVVRRATARWGIVRGAASVEVG